MKERNIFMKNKVYFTLGAAFYIPALILIGYIVTIVPHFITKYYIVDSLTMIKISILELLLLSIATLFILSSVNRKKIKITAVKIYVSSLGIIYLIFGGYLLFLTPHTVAFNNNFIPFTSILPAIFAILSDNSSEALIYVQYNIFIYVPMGLLFYYFSNKLKEFKYYFIVMSAIIITCTFIQMLLRTNSFNIDNILLSLFGIIFTYLIIDKFYLFIENKDSD